MSYSIFNIDYDNSIQIQDEKGNFITITKPFKNFAEANNWCKKYLLDNSVLLTDIPF